VNKKLKVNIAGAGNCWKAKIHQVAIAETVVNYKIGVIALVSWSS